MTITITKKSLLLVVLLLALIAAASAEATSLYQTMTYKGVTCRGAGSGIACVRTTADGYGVGISDDSVLVMNLSTGKTIFSRYQP